MIEAFELHLQDDTVARRSFKLSEDQSHVYSEDLAPAGKTRLSVCLHHQRGSFGQMLAIPPYRVSHRMCWNSNLCTVPSSFPSIYLQNVPFYTCFAPLLHVSNTSLEDWRC